MDSDTGKLRGFEGGIEDTLETRRFHSENVVKPFASETVGGQNRFRVTASTHDLPEGERKR